MKPLGNYRAKRKAVLNNPEFDAYSVRKTNIKDMRKERNALQRRIKRLNSEIKSEKLSVTKQKRSMKKQAKESLRGGRR